MTDKAYFELKNGEFVDSDYLAKVIYICMGEELPANTSVALNVIRDVLPLLLGVKREIEKPSVKYLIRHGQKTAAIKLYRDLHPECSLQHAYETINHMERYYFEKGKIR